MRRWRGLIVTACCLAAASGIAHLHGYERALGHADWQYRSALIEAYSGEVVFRAGPCVLAGLAALLSTWYGSKPVVVSVAAMVIAGVSAVGTYLTIQRYIVTPPGQFMPTTIWDGTALLGWVGAAVLLLITVVASLARLAGLDAGRGLH